LKTFNDLLTPVNIGNTMITIKNWKRFQHFKDRRPPWIKLYRDLLDDIEWHELDGNTAKNLVMIWLIGSENDGKLPDLKELAFRLRVTEKVAAQYVARLNEHWLIQDDINMISERYQNDAPETETETETEKIRRGSGSRVSKNSDLMIRIGAFLSRRETTKWSIKEHDALKALGDLEEAEIDVLEDYYRAELPKDSDYRRRDVITLLNNWTGELDRAREFWRQHAKERRELRESLGKSGEPSW
jgi:hypothetical protein